MKSQRILVGELRSELSNSTAQIRLLTAQHIDDSRKLYSAQQELSAFKTTISDQNNMNAALIVQLEKSRVELASTLRVCLGRINFCIFDLWQSSDTRIF